ncbi:MAG TPA: MFS transporter [Bryobacteraceae bacterium]|nr:MFS transporter [Bryobacteraceae bacterium]
MRKSDTRSTALLSGTAYAGMFVFGVVMAVLGAILPLLAARLQITTPDIGKLFLVMNAAMLAASLVLGLAMDRFGMKFPLVLGALLVAMALGMVVRASAFVALLPAVVLLGVGGGALNGATNTLVADLHEDPRRKGAALNLLGVFFGFGALFLPFVIGALVARFSIASLLAAASTLCGVVGIFALFRRFPAPKQRHVFPLAEVPRFLRSPLVLAFAFLLFFESGVEFTLGGFISTYLMHDIGLNSIAIASWILAAYWAAIMISRAVLSRIALGIDPYRTLLICASAAGVGAVLTALARSPLVAALGIVICGWSLAGVYPTLLGIAGDRFQSHSGTVFGILFAIALAGGMILPFIAGQLGALAGLRWVFGMISAAFAAILGLSLLARRIERQNQLSAEIA